MEFKAQMDLFDCCVDELLPDNIDVLVYKQKNRRGFLCWKVKQKRNGKKWNGTKF